MDRSPNTARIIIIGLVIAAIAFAIGHVLDGVAGSIVETQMAAEVRQD